MGELLRNARHDSAFAESRNDERRVIPRKPQNLTIILKGDFIALLPSLRGDLSPKQSKKTLILSIMQNLQKDSSDFIESNDSIVFLWIATNRKAILAMTILRRLR